MTSEIKTFLLNILKPKKHRTIPVVDTELEETTFWQKNLKLNFLVSFQTF